MDRISEIFYEVKQELSRDNTGILKNDNYIFGEDFSNGVLKHNYKKFLATLWAYNAPELYNRYWGFDDLIEYLDAINKPSKKKEMFKRLGLTVLNKEDFNSYLHMFKRLQHDLEKFKQFNSA